MDTMLDQVRDDRSREVGAAIQRTVAADPGLAVSIVGIGLDQLSSVLIHSPDQLPGFGGWIDLIDAVYGYVMRGERTPVLDELLSGHLAVTRS